MATTFKLAHYRKTLAFISPALAEAAMEGRLPRGFSVKRLTDQPILWSEQWRAIGLQQRPFATFDQKSTTWCSSFMRA